MIMGAEQLELRGSVAQGPKRPKLLLFEGHKLTTDYF